MRNTITALAKTISERNERLKPHQIMFCLSMKPIILNLANDKKCQKNKFEKLTQMASKQLEQDKFLCSSGELSERELEEDKLLHQQLVNFSKEIDKELQSCQELQETIDLLIKRQPVVG